MLHGVLVAVLVGVGWQVGGRVCCMVCWSPSSCAWAGRHRRRGLAGLGFRVHCAAGCTGLTWHAIGPRLGATLRSRWQDSCCGRGSSEIALVSSAAPAIMPQTKKRPAAAPPASRGGIGATDVADGGERVVAKRLACAGGAGQGHDAAATRTMLLPPCSDSDYAAAAASDNAQPPCSDSDDAAAAASDKDDFLHKYLQSILKRMTTKQRENIATHICEREFVISSGCTGSGMAEVVHVAAHQIFGRSAHAAFACEKIKSKRTFYRNVVEPHLAAPACCFEELNDLRLGAARCEAHGRSCAVPRGCDLFVCGFSCKDFSKLSGTFNAQERANILKQALGSSGRTFRDVRDHLQVSRPSAFILENVDAFGEDDGEYIEPNVEFLYQSLMDVGYVLSHGCLASTDYGLPQRRRRVYFVGVRLESFGLSHAEGTSLVRSVLAAAKGLQTPWKPIHDFLLPVFDGYLKAELERLSEAKEEHYHDADGAGWLAVHKEFFQSKGICVRDLRPPAALSANPWFKVLPRRSQEIVVYNCNVMRIQAGRDGQDKVLSTHDASQAINRTARGHNGQIQTLTPRMLTWLYSTGVTEKMSYSKIGTGRLVLGWEALALQGFPVSWLCEVPAHLRSSDTMLRDLAGNAFSSTVFGVIYLMLLAHLPPPSTSQSSSPEPDMQALLRLMS